MNNMKKILLTTLMTSAVLTIAGCERFSTSYERIDDDAFRLLDFIYEPADASPGDTVTLTAVFAGKPVGNMENYLDWQISFNVIRDIFGSQTIVETVSLRKLIAERRAWFITSQFSEKTQAAAFQFIIPNDIVKTSRSIAEDWTQVLRSYTNIPIPEPYASMTKSEIVDMIDNIDTSSPNADALKNSPFLPLLLQFFTVPIRISAQINDPGKRPHTIISSQSVRYNNRFRKSGWPAPYNRNPVIDSIVVFKVRGEDRLMFNSKNDRFDAAFTIFRSDNPYISKNLVDDPVIEFADGCTYFIEVISSEKYMDSVTTMTTGKRMQEKHHANWQFRLEPEETKNVKYEDYMDFRAIMETSWSIVPPKNHDIKNFTFWVTVTDADNTVNERMRPEGSTLREITGRFEYR